jgi:hypothetical protein
LRILSLPARAAQPDDLLDEICVANRGPSDHNILEHAKPLEERKILKCSSNAEPRQLLCRHLCKFPPVDPDIPPLRAINSADDIEQRAFAGAIRADDRADFSRINGEIKVCNRRYAVER